MELKFGQVVALIVGKRNYRKNLDFYPIFKMAAIFVKNA